MTENERRILDALSRAGALSKRDITARCGMGWATAVKMVARLEEEGYILPEGFERRNSAGKSPMVYTLSPAKPVALGIDVEYGRIHASIRNLRGEILSDLKQPTPAFRDSDNLVDFLSDLVREFQARADAGGLRLEGVGIGVPTHLFVDGSVPYARIESALGGRFGIRIRVDNNIRCFTHAVARFEPTGDSILVVTIRSGIGVGIVIDGKVYQGERGRSGELGHMLVDPEGIPCRCGRRGCLETIVNREALAREAGSRTIGELFSAARAGDADSLSTIARASARLGAALAQLLLVVDIRSILLYAAFGPDGEVMVPLVDEHIRSGVYPGLDFSLRYRELDEDSYVTGAAYLILRDFVEG